MIHFLYAYKYYLYNAFITHLPGYGFRRWYLNTILKYKIHPTASVHMGCFFTGAWLTVGAHSVINRKCYLDCRERITIGTNVSISPMCYIITASHDPQSPDFGGKNKPVVFEDYVWLGARVMIMPGVVMGRGSVAAAGSVVTKSVDEYSIVGGNPARHIKERTKELRYQLSWFPYFNTDL